jgi:hypothetical protein
VNEILRYNSVLDRVKVIYHLLRCVNYASLYSNLELIEVIFKALTLQPIYRLTKTFQLVQQNHPTEYDLFRTLTPQGLREKTPLCSPPAIPSLIYYEKEIQKYSTRPKCIEVASDAELGAGGGPVKHLALGDLRPLIRAQMTIERLQSVPYLFRYQEDIQRDVVNCRLYPLEEAALLQQSLFLQEE